MGMQADTEQKKHLEFVVETIRQIYTAPSTGAERDSKDKMIDPTVFKLFTDFLKNVPR